MINLIQQIVLVGGTFVGGATDTKTGYIYDWITYPMIIIGIILSLIQMQWFNIISGVILFLGLLIAYKFGKLGGGDVKIFTGLALLNPFNNIDFLTTIAIISAITAIMFYSIYYTIKYTRIGIKWKREREGIRRALLLGVVIIVYLFFMSTMALVSLVFVYLIGIPFMLGLLFVALQKGIKEEFFEKNVKLKELEEDEVLGEQNNKHILKLLKGKNLLGEKEIILLKKHGIKEVFVLRNLPKFGPFIFIGTLFAILVPYFFEILLFV